MRVFSEGLSVCLCASFPFGFEGGMWDLIVLIPDYFLVIYFTQYLFLLQGLHQVFITRPKGSGNMAMSLVSVRPFVLTYTYIRPSINIFVSAL